MKNKALAELAQEYQKRLSKYDKLEIVEIKDSDARREGEKILEILKGAKAKIYAMAEEGKCRSSEDFSKTLEEDLAKFGASVFIIGGPYGLSGEVKSRANELLSLSPMTFTHEWARAILLEQIYRAKSISACSGYHHK
ncbi:MAG: 23S rRNA (pseudouridine(1915)-N(3))-methyltransferase RlmH [Opitutales bacterium]|nr:23S rRNA (pseudouridine(1915)-N(3))-methyltransferase RlmH [Opitutales bacterium]